MSAPWVAATAECQKVSKSTCSSRMSVDGSNVTSASGCRTESTTVVTIDATTSSPAIPHRTTAARRSECSFINDTVTDAIPRVRIPRNRSPAPRES